MNPFEFNSQTVISVSADKLELTPELRRISGLSLEEQFEIHEQAERFRYFALQNQFREMFHVSLDAYWNLDRNPLHFSLDIFVEEVIIPQLEGNPLLPKQFSSAMATELTFGKEATWIIDKLVGCRRLTPEEILVGIANCPEEGPYEAYENVLLIRQAIGLQLLEPTQK